MNLQILMVYLRHITSAYRLGINRSTFDVRNPVFSYAVALLFVYSAIQGSLGDRTEDPANADDRHAANQSDSHLPVIILFCSSARLLFKRRR